MKRLLVYCCAGTCNVVLWTLDYEAEKPGYQEVEAVGEACKHCQEEDKKPPKFTPVRFGEQSGDDFGKLMKDRKADHKKKHGGKR